MDPHFHLEGALDGGFEGESNLVNMKFRREVVKDLPQDQKQKHE